MGIPSPANRGNYRINYVKELNSEVPTIEDFIQFLFSKSFTGITPSILSV